MQCVSPHGGRHSVGSVLRTACGFPCLLEENEKEAYISNRTNGMWVMVEGVGVVCVCMCVRIFVEMMDSPPLSPS